MSAQIPLSFPVSESYDAQDFMPADCNAEALDWINRYPHWPSPLVIFYGEQGCGKSHLLNLWAVKADAQIISAKGGRLGGAIGDDGQLSNGMAVQLLQDRLCSGDSVLMALGIDDADDLFTQPDFEETLFHLYNLAKENLTYILLSMSNNMALEAIQLPDLKSRLKAAPLIEIQSPDDVALQAVLVKLLHDRQLRVEPDVIAYILPRIERSFQAARDLVQKIDENSLAKKRSVTVPLVRDVLGCGLID